MNKYTKGAIATGAAIVLLLGGAGTFALWNDDAEVAGGSINSGTLTIEADGAGVWTELSDPSTPITIGSYLIVPGDVLVFTQDVNIEATGNNLMATLGYDEDSIVAGLGLASAELKAALDVDVDIAGPLGTEITDADSGAQTVTVTVSFPGASVDGLEAQDGSVDLSALLITLTQHL